jgi:hypothetical protein
MHKGVSGRWRDVLKREDIEQYKQLAREQLGTKCSNWLSGGRLTGKAAV